MILGFYPSAFTSTSTWAGNDIGYSTWMNKSCTTTGDDNHLYCRNDIKTNLNINTYLQPQNCERASQNPEPVNLDTILDMIWELSSIFNVRESGRDFMDEVESDVASVSNILQKTNLNNYNVLWFDSHYQDANSNTDDYYVVACCGPQGYILGLAGVTNVFKNLGTTTGESFYAYNGITDVETAFTNANPDIIVITDASYSPALEQLYILCSNPNLNKMTAVQKRRIVMIPFNAGAFGARIGISSKNLAEAFAAVLNLLPLNQDSFTQSKTDPSLAVGSSGVTAFLKFPKYVDSNGYTYDLDKICPGSNSIYLGSLNYESDDSSKSLSKEAIAGIVIGGFVAIIVIVVVMFMFGRKKGRDEMKLIGTPGLLNDDNNIEMTDIRSV